MNPLQTNRPLFNIDLGNMSDTHSNVCDDHYPSSDRQEKNEYVTLSKPINCPSPSAESPTNITSYAEDLDHYNASTWIMYQRIMNSRKTRPKRSCTNRKNIATSQHRGLPTKFRPYSSRRNVWTSESYLEEPRDIVEVETKDCIYDEIFHLEL